MERKALRIGVLQRIGMRWPARRWIASLGLLALWAMTAVAPAAEEGTPARSPEEESACRQLAEEIQGAVIYGREGRIRKVVIGEWKAIDLGEGNYARWSPDGKKIAVWAQGDIFVMNADGSGRKRLVSASVKASDGCPIEFHTNGREIIYETPGDRFAAVRIANGATRSLDLPGGYTGEPSISADGKRMAARIGNDLYAVDLVGKTHRKYAIGCSPNISPDGRRLLNNVGNHRQMAFRNWDGSEEFRIDARMVLKPDRYWDDHHWSNHNDYVATQGEGRYAEAYVVSISRSRATRVSWEGDVRCPDLYVARATGERAARTPER